MTIWHWKELVHPGLVWHVPQVDYFNNKVICDLVELPHKGVLAILDEACLNVGKVTDQVSHSSLIVVRIRIIITNISTNLTHTKP